MINKFVNGKLNVVLLSGAILIGGCAGGPLTTREKGAGIGALGGAAAGGLIGSAVGHPGVGAKTIDRIRRSAEIREISIVSNSKSTS